MKEGDIKSAIPSDFGDLWCDFPHVEGLTFLHMYLPRGKLKMDRYRQLGDGRRKNPPRKSICDLIGELEFSKSPAKGRCGRATTKLLYKKLRYFPYD